MPTAALLSTTLALAAQDPAASVPVRGTVTVERPAAGARHVLVWSLHRRRDGTVDDLSKADLFERTPDARVRAGDDGAFVLPAPARDVALFAFADVDGDGAWTPAVPEPCGFVQRVDTTDGDGDVAIVLKAPTHLPREDRVVTHGALSWRKGYPVVQLGGDAAERGHAHGLLLAPQIVDFFRFYMLEDRLGTADAYAAFAAFLDSHFAWPDALVREVDGVLAGMRASGAELFVPELGRAFSRTELFAINAYIDTRAMRSSCTQFACWGERTKGTDVDGGTIAGRNMDGEIDLRRVTVSHFVLFAVDPSEPGQQRYVSMMWPGFVGTLTGFNQSGVHVMENAGGTGPGPVVDRLVPISWVMREALLRFDATKGPEDFEALLAANANAAGGACGAGCIVLFALPSTAALPAWVLEGDRFGHASRRPGEVAPFVRHAVMASNHHFSYGADADDPGTHFGRTPSFSSRWRYEAGRHKLEAWTRTGRAIGTEEIRGLLRTVAHGTTEHSIVTRPDAREFDVAVASMKAEPWDAPYRDWTTFRFDELFARGDERGDR
jgi:hypothetical protein